MRTVLKFENRYIREFYLFTLSLTIVVILESLMTSKTSTLPIFLIGSSIGYSLFWLNEIVVWRFILLGKMQQTMYLQGIILLCRCTILVGLLYFLFVSMDIIHGIMTCIVYFVSAWFVSKDDKKKRGINIKIFELASTGLIVVLGFCVGHFVGQWIGGYYGNAVFGSKIGLVLGLVATLVQVGRWGKQRRDAQKAQDVKEDNLLSPNIDSSFS